MNILAASLLFLSLAEAPAPKVAVQKVPVIDGPTLTVHLLVKARPTLADRDWLTLEFTNRGKEPIAIDVAHYSINCVAKGRLDKKWQLQTVLTSGNSRDLFPKPVKPGPERPALVLKPGETYRVSEHLSDFGAAALGLPPRGGLDVACTVKLFVYMSDRQVFETPPEHLKFAFEWASPDEAGIKRIQERLKELLRNPVDELHHTFIVGNLLRTEEIAQAITRDELLAAMKRRSARLEGRFHIADVLVRNRDAKKEVLEFYGDRMRAREFTALDEVHHLKLWSPSFIPAVADFYGPHATINGMALDVLHRNRADWLKEKDEVRKLLARIKKQHPLLDKNPKQLEGEQLAKWANGLRDLALVADRSVVASLRPALDDKRTWWRPDPRAAFSMPPPPLIRVCDTAYDAIITILDDKTKATPRRIAKQTEDEYIAERDAAIEKLQKRLTELDKGEK